MTDARKAHPKRPQPAPPPPAARPRKKRPATPPAKPQPTAPRWAKESGPKICLKCGGRMFPADWIWQKYGLCLGWRCSKCKERVLARSLPFKGLRKRSLDADETAFYKDAAARWAEGEAESPDRDKPERRR